MIADLKSHSQIYSQNSILENPDKIQGSKIQDLDFD